MIKYIELKKAIITNVTGLDAITRAPIVDYETNHRCLRIQNVAHNEPFIKWGFTNVSENNFDTYQLKKEDIIISRTGGSIGSLIYIDNDLNAVFNNGLIRLQVDTKKYNSKFIYYCLKNKEFLKHIIHCSLGNSTQENIRMNDLLTYKIPDYSLYEQNLIEGLLSSIDSKIENNNKTISTLESLAKTIYDYWFLQFEFPNEEGKPYKSSGGKMVWNEELKREIPEGWEVREFGEIFNIVKGKIPNDSLSNEMNETNSTPYITIDVANGGVAQYCNSDNLIDLNGETIMVMDGAASGDVYVGNKGILGSTFSKLISMRKDISDRFIYEILNSNKVIYKKANTGSTVPHANSNFIRAMKIPLPKNCDYYSKTFNSISDNIINLKQQNQQLVSLRDWLLPMLMNGQVTFKEDTHE